jgi:hypothetical protein
VFLGIGEASVFVFGANFQKETKIKNEGRSNA